MIRTDVTLDNLYVLSPAHLTNQTTHLFRDVATQHSLAVLRDEHEVVAQTVNRMARTTILRHKNSVPQAS